MDSNIEKIVLMFIIAYLLGSIPSGVWIGKAFFISIFVDTDPVISAQPIHTGFWARLPVRLSWRWISQKVPLRHYCRCSFTLPQLIRFYSAWPRFWGTPFPSLISSKGERPSLPVPGCCWPINRHSFSWRLAFGYSSFY